ncbi:MAG TPA: hypothetical protein VN618_01550 [Solirubrobacteraceae bacterium]|nr:hypothetical protein [Solirubrobacteraceae bacterium]
MAPLLAVAMIGMLALIPTAGAQAGTPAVTVPPAEAVEAALAGTPLGSLPPEQLAEAISELQGLEGAEPQKLQETLQKLIESLTSGTTLGELLGGNPVAKLSEALQSAGAGEVVGKLLELSSEPQALIAQLLGALGPETLQGLLGTVPTGEPFSASTVEELAGKLETTPQALAAELGKNAEQLPAKAMALTGPLANGETLAVLNGLGGITLGLVKETAGTVGLTGGTGGPGGGGGSGTPGATVTVPASPSPGAAGTAASRKLRLISHRVKGAVATVVVEVPAAGSLAGRGRGVRPLRRETARAERVTLHPALSRAASSALHRRHRRLRVPFSVTFAPVGGPSSSVSMTLSYR